MFAVSLILFLFEGHLGGQLESGGAQSWPRSISLFRLDLVLIASRSSHVLPCGQICLFPSMPRDHIITSDGEEEMI